MCGILPFGDFTGGEILLRYLHARIKACRRDLVFMNSKRAYHNVDKLIEHKESCIFVNHFAIHRRFTFGISQDMI